MGIYGVDIPTEHQPPEPWWIGGARMGALTPNDAWAIAGLSSS